MMLAQHSLNLCQRQQLPLALVFMDLDKFKQINDNHGHVVGDQVLSFFANQLKSTCREMDICARIGGDEFVLLLMGSSKQDAERVMSRLKQSMLRLNHEHTFGQNVSFSHGIIEVHPNGHHAIETLLALGDSIMYQHKRANR